MNNKAKRRCAARGCRVPVYRSYLMCSEHWRQVPMLLRRELSAAYTARGGKPSSPMTQRYADAMIACIRAVATVEAAQARAGVALDPETLYIHPDDTSSILADQFGDDTLTDKAIFAADQRRMLDQVTNALGVPADIIYGAQSRTLVEQLVDYANEADKRVCGYGVIDQRFAEDGNSVVCVVGCNLCALATRELTFEITPCHTCNARGGKVDSQTHYLDIMPGVYSGATEYFFEMCDDCIGNGLCPGCGNLIIDIEAANEDIYKVGCAICGWHYDPDWFNDYGDDYYDDGSSSVDYKLDDYTDHDFRDNPLDH